MGMESEQVLGAASRALEEGEHRAVPVAAPQGFDQNHCKKKRAVGLRAPESVDIYHIIACSQTYKDGEPATTSQHLHKQD